MSEHCSPWVKKEGKRQILVIPASIEVLDFETVGIFCYDGVVFEPGSQLREIEDGAFCFSHGPKTICLPAYVSKLTGSAFSCTSWSSFKVEPGKGNLCVRDHFLLDSGQTCILFYFGESKKVRIPDHIESIGHSAFSRRSLLASVSFGQRPKLRSIGTQGFESSPLLKSICIPSSVRELGDMVFMNCVQLRTLTFERNSELTRIGASALCGCSSLSSLCLPSSVKFVGEKCFSECSKLSRLTFELPSHLRELLGLPPSYDRFVAVPDSVETLGMDGTVQRPTITFGVESRLTSLLFPQSVKYSERYYRRAFVRLAARSVKSMRGVLEFCR
jgi:hypothetical protein